MVLTTSTLSLNHARKRQKPTQTSAMVSVLIPLLKPYPKTTHHHNPTA
ncbi:hypothetical protein Ahy_B01g053401 isoform B [Arachis hypogaea]|uniref:Uncharacterized protein n=1 Tax=Arachis hypogaea TaxID=3818 RepID=A0A445ARN4_ARAHY|nr:hypothetical protein Ahy_B01g053401 isoform B [Arachis hypogaea]